MPGALSRLRSLAGNPRPATIPTITLTTASTNIPIPDDGEVFNITNASCTIATITAPVVRPGRIITLIGVANATVTMTNNSATTTKWQMDIGTDRSFILDSTITLILTANGTWRCVSVLL